VTRARYAATAFVLSLALVAACSSSSSSNGNKDAFCKDNATLDAVTSHATSLSQLPQIFKDNRSTIDDFQKNAPSSVKSDADLLANAAKKAADTGDASAFSNSDLQSAGQRVDEFCGQGSSSSNGGRNSSTSESSSSTGTDSFSTNTSSSSSDTSSSTDTSSSSSSST
jgi:hypothetical protein